MNTKKMSKIRNKAKAILVEWLQSLLNKEEASKITVKNVFDFIPLKVMFSIMGFSSTKIVRLL